MIRRAALVDVEAIVGIFEPSFASLDFLPRLHDHEENVAYFRRQVLEGEAYLLGRGFAIVRDDELSHLYVHPDAIGRGIGRALLEHVKALRPRGFELWVFQQNERARRFYERNGCRAIRFTNGELNGERTPDVLYEWRPATPGSRAR